MNRSYSPLADGMGCLVNAYLGLGSLYGTVLYCVVALDLLMRGDLCGFLGWIFLLGPIVTALAGTVWPVALFVWPFGGGSL
jgi:hypothetical protein